MKCLLIGGCEVIFEGTKEECISRYKSFPSPVPMRLYSVRSEHEIFKDLSLKRIIVGESV
jgi:hypothetical protein